VVNKIIIELKTEVQSLFEQLEGQGKLPLTSGNALSPQFDNILVEIFHKFDKDSDNQLNFNELNNLITTINKGAQPPKEFILQIINHFATNSPSALSLKGFKNFFLYQSLEDPEEMRNDLTALGYDGNSLAKLEDLMSGMRI
jgi:Ca2+-binding EF-hand superfamily protein